jgi:hypothetical protein
MIVWLHSISSTLYIYRRFIYLISLLLIINIIYRLIFLPSTDPIDHDITMLNLLSLAWLALVNFTLHAFVKSKQQSGRKIFVLSKLKAMFKKWLDYLLLLLFSVLSLGILALSIRMLRLYAA